ncbi:MAG: DUF1569 domain-containing protein [Bacteroidota bacterium]
MKNLFERGPLEEILGRIAALKPDSQRYWGRMSVAQMMKHCRLALDNAMGNHFGKRAWWSYLLAPFWKSRYYSPKPFLIKNLPTHSAFEIAEEQTFQQEKEALEAVLHHFYRAGPQLARNAVHPILGRFTPEQWAIGQYKHLDHHLRQFGV